ncbi:MAG: HAMP domain-containing protein, partial [Acidobacteriota bacterium]|nr:HAMP domain-containing protein [Acidobacteriota bacterium]
MHSLRTKILTIVLAFLAFIGAAFVLYSMVTTMNYKRLRLENTQRIVDFETEKVNKEIAEVERSAITFALNGFLFYTSQSYDVGITSVLEYMRTYPGAVGGGFWFEPYAYNKGIRYIGMYAFFDEKSGGLRLSESNADDPNDYYSKNWYRELVDAITRPNQVAWTKPYVDDSDSLRLMTTAGAGIFNERGELIGVSTVDWGMEEIIKTLSGVSLTKNSSVLLSAPGQDYIISGTRADSGIGASVKSLPYDINADSFELDGVSYLQFGRFMNNGWLMSVQIPEREIFAEIERQNNRFSVIIALSSIILLCFAYYLISKLINAPLRRLASDVSQVALGNLDKRIDLSSKDELGMLAQTFNKMTAELKEAIEEYNRERSEKERIGAELRIANEIQASMLPHFFTAFSVSFDLYASMLPAKEVGGDFYDFFLIDEDNLAVVVADVSGKGVPAALFMVITKTLIKYNACSGKSPKEVLETVNDMLCEGNDACMFVTAFIGFYNIPGG